MHPVFQNGGGGEKYFTKITSDGVDQKILISKRGCIMGQVNILKGVVQGIFVENRKLHNYSVINQEHASKDSICSKVN